MDIGGESYKKYLSGDDEGLVEIIKEYKDGLMFFLNGLTGDLHLAEEFAEETFFTVAVKKPSFRGKSSFKTWLYAMGRNIARAALRKRSRTVPMPDGGEDLLTEEYDAEAEFFRDERRMEIGRAMDRLPPDYRTALYLVFFEDMKNDEAAKVMKKSKRQIENLLYRAKGALRRELERGGITNEDL